MRRGRGRLKPKQAFTEDTDSQRLKRHGCDPNEIYIFRLVSVVGKEALRLLDETHVAEKNKFAAHFQEIQNLILARPGIRLLKGEKK
jgi:hypothetical protein